MADPKKSAPSAPASRAAVLVLGMHRSGTSALTRIIAAMGADLPATLLHENESNRTGHWESDTIRKLNNEILASAGSSWQDWLSFNVEWYHSPYKEAFLDRAVEALGAEFGRSPLFVLKDPRICRLLPFWAEALDRFGARPLICLSHRNPIEVAASLQKRNNLHPSLGMLIWLRHVIDAERATRDLPRAAVNYRDVLADWQSVVRTLQSNWQLAFPRKIERAALDVNPFLSAGHRHHHAPSDNLSIDATIPLWVRDAYAILQDMPEGVPTPQGRERLDAIHDALEAAGSAFERVVAIGQHEHSQKVRAEAAAAEKAAQARQQQIDDLYTEHERQTSEIDSLKERGNRLEERVKEATRINIELRHHLTDLESKHEDARQLAAQAAEVQSQLGQVQSALRQRSAEASELNDELSAAHNIIAGLNTDRQRVAAQLLTICGELGIDPHAALQHAAASVGTDAPPPDFLTAVTASIDALRQRAADDSTAFAADVAALIAAHANGDERLATLQAHLVGRSSSAASSLHDAGAQIVSALGHLDAQVQAKLNAADRAANESNQRFAAAITSIIVGHTADGRRPPTLDERLAGLPPALAAAGKEIHLALAQRETEMTALTRARAEASRAAAEQRQETSKLRQSIKERDARISRFAALAAARDQEKVAVERELKEMKREGTKATDQIAHQLETMLNSVLRARFIPLLHERRLRAYAALVEKVGIFDRAWYVDRYTDVAGSGLDPAWHYVRYGAREGRAPNATIDAQRHKRRKPKKIKASAERAAIAPDPDFHG